MALALYRLARACAGRARLVAAVWLVLLAALGGGALALGSTLSSQVTIPGTEAQQAIDDLRTSFPGAGGATGLVVFAAPEGQTVTTPAAAQAIQATVKEATAIPGVVAATDPLQAKLISPDQRYALMQVQFSTGQDQITDAQRSAYGETGAAAEKAGLKVIHGGDLSVPSVEIGVGEVIGVVVALVVLVVTLGSLVAAGMTMLNALLGVGVGMTGLLLLSNTFEMTNTAPILALMLGLAVGIDYSLFITTRHRSFLGEGLAPRDAAARAVGTAGSAVLFAGLTVVIALAGLSVVGIPFLTVMGLAAAGTVAVAVVIALTLLPALLTLAGTRIRPRVAAHDTAEQNGGMFRWARWVAKHRVVAALLVVVTLGTIAVPALDLRLGLPDAGTAPAGSERREAFDTLSQAFGPGFNGQLTVVVQGADAAGTTALANATAQRIQGLPDVLAVAPPRSNPAGTTAIVQVVPRSEPTSEATQDLVQAIRDDNRAAAEAADGSVRVTGQTAVAIDVSDKLAGALPFYLVIVVGLSILLLGLVFRSIVVPVKATVGFLLSIVASFGAAVAVFQWGWLSGLLGVDTTGPLVAFLPILLIGILFGLAMDYEVFLVSRMREEFVHGASPGEAMVRGVGYGGRVVVAAALIMIAVFGGFVSSDDVIIKSMGFTLAFGVLVDAFLVRMLLVPAVMAMLGRAAWWLPRGVDRVLPKVDIEGESLRRLDSERDSEESSEEPREVERV